MRSSAPGRPSRRGRIRGIQLAGLTVVITTIVGAAGCHSLPASPRSSAPPTATATSPVDVPHHAPRRPLHLAVTATVWPAAGQAAFIQTGQTQVTAGPNQHPAPIASLAKIMTAYLVLRDHPLSVDQDGPTITLTDDDVADTAQQRSRGESVVSIAAGERLSERQALQALLVPSANNIAEVLARWDAGSRSHFVAEMNATARTLGMNRTHYTDPSGYAPTTVSTAADQVLIVQRAMSLPVFASIVATPTVTLPVAGTVHNTDTLLGRDGFVGVKTGSTDAAGGCFAFRAVRWVRGTQTTITGVVLGQPGANQVQAGLVAAADMVDRIAGVPAASRTPRGMPQRQPPLLGTADTSTDTAPGANK